MAQLSTFPGVGAAALLAVLLLGSTFAAAVFAAEPKTELLWPGGAPGAKGDGDRDKPALTVHLAAPEKANGTAVVICPGGGYGALMLSYEGHDIAKWLNQYGVAGIVLKYRVSPYRHPAPLLDSQRAMRIVRAKAKEWSLDPKRIGIMGFSAGGHVASTLGTHFDAGDPKAADPIEQASCRPDFLVLVYPVITMSDKGGGICRETLLGKTPAAADVDLLSNEKQVTAQTPPTFLVHSKLDQTVPVIHSAMFCEALKAHQVPVEFLELPTGAHGLGCGKGELWAAWEAKCLEWFKARGLVKE
ncbi:MAG: alpha/beta hydrolase [Planctomycetota bacterium]